MKSIKLLVAAVSMLGYGITVAAELDQHPALKRFDADQKLGAVSVLDIRELHTGQDILTATAHLQEQGGELAYISGGSRSRKLSVSFHQPYQDSRLEQEYVLNFHKDKGFIHTLEVVYKLDSAYLDIQPVYQQVLAKAMDKYGVPLMFSQVIDQIGTAKDARLQAWLETLVPRPDISQAVTAYFDKFLITPKTRFVDTDSGAAKLISGFRECYFWSRNSFSEVLSLCAFRPGSGNMKGQGVHLTLTSFAVNQAIEDYRAPQEQGLDIEF